MIRLSCKERLLNTIATIEYSDEFEDNWDLFTKGIDILKDYDCESDFSDENREVLEEIFSIISD